MLTCIILCRAGLILGYSTAVEPRDYSSNRADVSEEHREEECVLLGFVGYAKGSKKLASEEATSTPPPPFAAISVRPCKQILVTSELPMETQATRQKSMWQQVDLILPLCSSRHIAARTSPEIIYNPVNSKARWHPLALSDDSATAGLHVVQPQHFYSHVRHSSHSRHPAFPRTPFHGVLESYLGNNTTSIATSNV
jgi:hypothetical protein